MPPIPQQPQTEDSKDFDPDKFFAAWAKTEIGAPKEDNHFRNCIIKAFNLPEDDDYRYAAVATVTLAQAQHFVELGAQGPLHAWYRDEKGQPTPNPTPTDITAYTTLFLPSTSTPKSLIALASNAKKLSLRSQIATHLTTNHHPPTALAPVPKLKSHTNPYLDIWLWTCQNLEWGGPIPETALLKTSHPILPVLYHHFGCVVPSYESLYLIRELSRGRRVLDVGSGNGYWCYMLRRLDAEMRERSGGGKKKKRGVEDGEEKGWEVLPIDNGMSEWRTVWVGDTLQVDGVQWLVRNGGGKEDVLLLVYPVVGNEFTSRIIKAYKGTTIISAGAQNASGFTAFAKETLAQWMAREMPDWEQVLQIPLPSFAGKDEALFAFEKK